MKRKTIPSVLCSIGGRYWTPKKTCLHYNEGQRWMEEKGHASLWHLTEQVTSMNKMLVFHRLTHFTPGWSEEKHLELFLKNTTFYSVILNFEPQTLHYVVECLNHVGHWCKFYHLITMNLLDCMNGLVGKETVRKYHENGNTRKAFG